MASPDVVGRRLRPKTVLHGGVMMVNLSPGLDGDEGEWWWLAMEDLCWVEVSRVEQERVGKGKALGSKKESGSCPCPPTHGDKVLGPRGVVATSGDLHWQCGGTTTEWQLAQWRG
jgi:hypothetical protein